MTQLVLETEIDAPVATCLALALDVDTHLSFPGSRERAVGGVTSGPMALGDHVTWQSKQLIVPVRMTSLITALGDDHFVDELFVRRYMTRLVTSLSAHIKALAEERAMKGE